jgi:hypothetical protein
MQSRLERDLQRTAQYIYNIPCECGRSYYSGEKFFYILLPNSVINRNFYYRHEHFSNQMERGFSRVL